MEIEVGGPGGTPFLWMCPRGFALTSLGVFGTPQTGGVVGRLRSYCRPLVVEGLNIVSSGSDMPGPEFGAASQNLRGRIHCPTDEYAVGVFGRAGLVMDQIGLICSRLRLPLGNDYDAVALYCITIDPAALPHGDD